MLVFSEATSSLASELNYKDVRKEQGGRFLGRKDEKSLGQKSTDYKKKRIYKLLKRDL